MKRDRASELRAIDAFRNALELPRWYSDDELLSAIRAYLTSATPPDVAGLIERLEEGTNGTDITKTDPYLNALMRQAATALRLSAGGGVPEGWILVPVEPTEEMIGEGDRVMYGRYGCSFEVAPIYDAMLAASPTVEAGHVE